MSAMPFAKVAAGIRDYLLAELNQRMNIVMKVLFYISTIFLPLTFLVGIYGMNFHRMPELEIPWAYPALWSVFLLVGGACFSFQEEQAALEIGAFFSQATQLTRWDWLLECAPFRTG